MANPLYDELFGTHAGKSETFLQLQDGTQISYQDFLAMAARMAGAIASLGVTPGARVAAQIHKSPEALAL